MFRKASVLLFAVLVAGGLHAATTNTAPASPSSSGFSFGAMIGAVNINGVTYTQFVLNPDLKLGKFRVGLDVNLEFDQEGNLRKGEWDSWQAIVSKLRHIGYGDKGDKVFVKIGSLPDVLLGHGTIMKGFSNNLFYPDARMLGIQLDIDFKWFGFESFVDNFLDYDILVGRAYIRPLLKSGIPLLKRIEIGATYARDFDNMNFIATNAEDKYKYSDNPNSTNNLAVYGIDVAIPLPNLLVLNWTWFADYVQIQGAGAGFTTGIMGKVLGIFNWRIEYNRFGKNFIGSYFDYYYLYDRPLKYALLSTYTEAYNGWKLALWKNFSFVAPDDLTILVEVQDQDADGIKPQLLAQLHVDRKLLFKKLEFDLLYVKKNIQSFRKAFVIEDEDTIITMKTGYMIADNVMLSVTYTKSFAWVDGVLDSQESTTIQTEIKF